LAGNKEEDIMPKIKIDKALYEKAKQFAEAKGYSSVEECVSTILEREFNLPGGENDEDVLKRMKGLGYIS
jgi:hypothetical protein